MSLYRGARLAQTLALAWLLCSASISAQEDDGKREAAPAVPNQWLFELGHDSLDDGSPDWSEYAITRSGLSEDERQYFFTLRRTDRFGEEDTELELGTTGLLSKNWLITIEGSVAPSHNVLPKASGHLGLTRVFSNGFLVGGGYRVSTFTEDSVKIATFTLERQWERVGALYTFARSRLATAAQNSHAAELHLKYGEAADNQVGLLYVTGAEAVRLGSGRVEVSDIDSVALAGHHWFAPQWGFTYSVGQFEQGDFYTRDGIRIGLAYRML